jgi:hypothetical protein
MTGFMGFDIVELTNNDELVFREKVVSNTYCCSTIDKEYFSQVCSLPSFSYFLESCDTQYQIHLTGRTSEEASTFNRNQGRPIYVPATHYCTDTLSVDSQPDEESNQSIIQSNDVIVIISCINRFTRLFDRMTSSSLFFLD